MSIGELTSEQTRQMVDVRQAFAAWREARQEFLHGYEGSYKGRTKWRRRDGKALNALHTELRKHVADLDIGEAA